MCGHKFIDYPGNKLIPLRYQIRYETDYAGKVLISMQQKRTSNPTIATYPDKRAIDAPRRGKFAVYLDTYSISLREAESLLAMEYEGLGSQKFRVKFEIEKEKRFSGNLRFTRGGSAVLNWCDSADDKDPTRLDPWFIEIAEDSPPKFVVTLETQPDHSDGERVACALLDIQKLMQKQGGVP